MGAGAVVLSALKTVGSWVLKNPAVVVDTVDEVAKIQANKKAESNEEHLQIVDEKLEQLGEAALELDKKIDTEMAVLHKQIHTIRIMLLVMGAILGVSIISIVLLEIF